MFSWENHRTKWWMFQCHGFFFRRGTNFCGWESLLLFSSMGHLATTCPSELMSEAVTGIPFETCTHRLQRTLTQWGSPKSQKKLRKPHRSKLGDPKYLKRATATYPVPCLDCYTLKKMVGLPKILVKLSHRSCYTYP